MLVVSRRHGHTASWDIAATFLASCAADPSDGAAASDHLRVATELARAGDAEGALDALERSLDAGHPAPSEVLRTSELRPLIDDPEEPAHVHYDITQDGRLLRAAELLFDDDPRLVGGVRREADAERLPIASVRRDDDGTWHAEVTIPVRGLR